MQTAIVNEHNENFDEWLGNLVAKGANICVTGKPGSGKTTYLAKMINEYFPTGKAMVLTNQNMGILDELEVTSLNTSDMLNSSEFIIDILRMRPETVVFDNLTEFSEGWWNRIGDLTSASFRPDGAQMLATAALKADDGFHNVTYNRHIIQRLRKTHFDVVVQISDGQITGAGIPGLDGYLGWLWYRDEDEQLSQKGELPRSLRRRLSLDLLPSAVPRKVFPFRLREFLSLAPDSISVGEVRPATISDWEASQETIRQSLQEDARVALEAFENLEIKVKDMEEAKVVLDFIRRMTK